MTDIAYYPQGVGTSGSGGGGGGANKKSGFTVNGFHTYTGLTANRYYTPGGANNNATLARTILTVPYACTVSNLKIEIRSNSLSTDAVDFTVQKDTGGGMTDTAVTVQIPAGAGNVGLFEDITNTASFAVGDEIVINAVQAGAGGGSAEIASILLEFNET